jgi:hypothetical protein
LTKWKFVMSPPKYVPDVASEPTYSGVDESVTLEELLPDARRVPFL